MVIVGKQKKQKHRRRGLTKRENCKGKLCLTLTVAARMSCGQQARRKDLQTFGSLYFVPADSPAKKYIVRKYNFQRSISLNNVHLLNKYEGNIHNSTRFHRINDMMYSMCSWDLKIAIVCLFLLEKGRQEKVALKTLDHIGTILTHPGRSAKVSALQLVSFFWHRSLDFRFSLI